MKLISRLFVVALIVLLVYSFMQVARLKKDVKVLRNEVKKLRAEVYDLREEVAKGPGQQSKTRSLIEKANAHAKNARQHTALAVQYGKKGDLNRSMKEYGLAKQEYEESVRLLGLALKAGVSPVRASMQKLEDTVRNTGGLLQRMWDSLDQEKKPAAKPK